MRTTLSFDTLKYVNILESSGMKREYAEASAKAIADMINEILINNEPATKVDLELLRENIKSDTYITIFKVFGSLLTLQTAIMGIVTFLLTKIPH